MFRPLLISHIPGIGEDTISAFWAVAGKSLGNHSRQRFTGSSSARTADAKARTTKIESMRLLLIVPSRESLPLFPGEESVAVLFSRGDPEYR